MADSMTEAAWQAFSEWEIWFAKQIEGCESLATAFDEMDGEARAWLYSIQGMPAPTVCPNPECKDGLLWQDDGGHGVRDKPCPDCGERRDTNSGPMWTHKGNGTHKRMVSPMTGTPDDELKKEKP